MRRALRVGGGQAEHCRGLGGEVGLGAGVGVVASTEAYARAISCLVVREQSCLVVKRKSRLAVGVVVGAVAGVEVVVVALAAAAAAAIAAVGSREGE